MNSVKKAILILLVVVSLIAIALGYYCIQLRNQLSVYITQEAIDFDADTMDEINELKTEGKPIIVVFGADYCPTCVSYRPYIKELNRIYGEGIVIKYIDTVEHESIRKEYNIERYQALFSITLTAKRISQTTALRLSRQTKL